MIKILVDLSKGRYLFIKYYLYVCNDLYNEIILNNEKTENKYIY